MNASTILKAARLIDEGRVHATARPDRFVVVGDAATHAVRVHPDDDLASCTCTAGRTGRRCSHALAARYLRDDLDRAAVPA